jgi:trans-aconitate 2-methyltransferase
MNTKWNPGQYEKFKAQRAKPFYDLMNLIERRPISQAVDLGCGTGELTKILFDDLKPEKMIAIDASPQMLSKSKEAVTRNLNFQLTDISKYEPHEKIDLIFSNAALQWLPHHEVLFPKILSWISKGGQIAIQMPFNFDHPSHVIAARVAKRLFPSVFAEETQRFTLNLERYAEILFKNGFESQIARIEIYGHPMKSGYEVIEWTKGTLLTGYQSKLNETQFTDFLNSYKSELIAEIGEGPYFYAFKRALLWGKKVG